MTPTRQSETATLRDPRLSDHPAWEAYWASDRTIHTDGPKHPPVAWDDFAAGFGLWRVRRYGCRAVDNRAAGGFDGSVRFNHPAHFPKPEPGWKLLADAGGKSIACQSENALLGRVWSNTGLTSVVRSIAPENHRAIRLAERPGAARDDAAPRRDPADLVYRHRRVA